MLWLTKQLYAKIAGQNLFLLKMSRHSTKKKDSKTNHKDVLNVEKQENNKGIIEIDTNNNVISSIKVDLINNPLLFI